jgi:hypothetical protein
MTRANNFFRPPKKIPLLKYSRVDNCRQFVFGRVNNLLSYYYDQENFITLMLPDELYYGEYLPEKNMYINDFFVYCSIIHQSSCHSNKSSIFFPIRIVLHPRDSILFKSRFIKKLNDLFYKRIHSSELILQWNEDYHYSTILAREICQLISLFDISIFQSNSYKHIFFIKVSSKITHSIKGLTKIYPI